MAFVKNTKNLGIDDSCIIQVDPFSIFWRKLPLLRIFGRIPVWQLYSDSKVHFLSIFNGWKYSSFKDKFDLEDFFKDFISK